MLIKHRSERVQRLFLTKNNYIAILFSVGDNASSISPPPRFTRLTQRPLPPRPFVIFRIACPRISAAFSAKPRRFACLEASSEGIRSPGRIRRCGQAGGLPSRRERQGDTLARGARRFCRPRLRCRSGPSPRSERTGPAGQGRRARRMCTRHARTPKPLTSCPALFRRLPKAIRS